MGKGLSPQQMVLRKLNTAEKWNERLIFHHTQKATRRGSDLNVRPETVKLLAEHIRREPLNIALGSNFRIWHLKHKEERKIDTWGYVKFKSSCPAKGTINKTKRQPTEWEKYLYNHGQISPTFWRFALCDFKPLCFYKRPTWVSDFPNWKESSVSFLWKNKKQRQRSVFVLQRDVLGKMSPQEQDWRHQAPPPGATL